jgi:U3 small nucleolar RNA-associated protein 23
MSEVIDLAKTLERRRCGHHPEEFAEPLSTLECLKEVVDPKSNHSNKHNYVVASQSQQVRQAMREIKGVPLIYVTRSVMLMEPLSTATIQVRKKEELSKFRDGIQKTGTAQKRKREGEDEMVLRRGDSDIEAINSDADAEAEKQDNAEPVETPSAKDSKKRKKRKYGIKGPNPLSVKRAKRPERLKS